MFYLYFSLFNKNIHEVKNIAIRIVSCHTYRDTYRIVKMCIVTSLGRDDDDDASSVETDVIATTSSGALATTEGLVVQRAG